MRFVILLMFAAGCYHTASVVPLRVDPQTSDERCIQTEIQCIDQSSAGTTEQYFFFTTFYSSVTGNQIVRRCELQGELCRERAKQAEKTERAARQNLPMQLED